MVAREARGLVPLNTSGGPSMYLPPPPWKQTFSLIHLDIKYIHNTFSAVFLSVISVMTSRQWKLQPARAVPSLHNGSAEWQDQIQCRCGVALFRELEDDQDDVSSSHLHQVDDRRRKNLFCHNSLTIKHNYRNNRKKPGRLDNRALCARE